MENNQSNPEESRETEGMATLSKWSALEKLYKDYRAPQFTSGRIAKDAVISLIPGSLWYNMYQMFKGVNDRDKAAEEVYDKINPGVPTIKEHLFIKQSPDSYGNRLFRALNLAIKVGAAYTGYLIEVPIVAHALNLCNGSENPIRDASLLAGGYLMKTALNAGLRYGADYTKNHTKSIRSLDETL